MESLQIYILGCSGWSCTLQLAIWIKTGEIQAYCCALTASLLRGSALARYHISCQRSPTAIPRTWAEIRAALEKQFGVIQETRNARDKLRTLV